MGNSDGNFTLVRGRGGVMTYKRKYFATVSPEHVGKTFFNAFDGFPLGSGFGRIMQIDVGKQIFMQGNTPCIENSDQRDLRQAKEAHHAVTGD